MSPTAPNQPGQGLPPAAPTPGSSVGPTPFRAGPQPEVYQNNPALRYQATQPGQPSVTAQPANGAPQPKTNPSSTQNMLQMAEIRDGIVIMNDGSFRSIVMVK